MPGRRAGKKSWKEELERRAWTQNEFERQLILIVGEEIKRNRWTDGDGWFLI
jgi:hypothetical protein